LVLLLACLLPAFSQSGMVSGRVSDEENREAIPYVTVYVNGTTIGTITDETGYFELEVKNMPCELILSHISYQVRSIKFDQDEQLTDLRLSLRKRILKINELTVIGKSERDKYLLHFKQWLLGVDHQELDCDILNDSVIRFLPLEGGQFEAFASQPIEVIIPENGYILKIDLIHFWVLEKAEVGGLHCSILGYFFFNEIPAKSRRSQRKIARNRVRSYYNSRLHFCRSLYQNRLAENGYELINGRSRQAESEQEEGSKSNYKYWYSTGESGTGILYITGYWSPKYYIYYYQTLGNKPADLSVQDGHPANQSRSGVYFDSDTLRIYSSGRVGDNNLLFNGAIGDKRVAWMLPFDYIPSMQ
jgi:hypothetical protein